MTITSPTRLVSVFLVVVPGGAGRLTAPADRHGNARTLPDDPAGFGAIIAEMHEAGRSATTVLRPVGY